MEPLLRQLRELPQRLLGLPGRTQFALVAGLVLAVGVAAGVTAFGNATSYQYAFTNLTAEDGAEAGAQLRGAGIPFRLEAGGTALAVPAHQVYDARLLLAAAGLPRGGGVGFELFDRGDLVLSEFTQKVNLRRAIEGELARTVGSLAEVRSARVHLTLGEKGLYRDEERKASAAVVVNLKPGRTLGDKEIAGIRHLVSSAVPGLAMDAVTLVDGKGTVLSTAGTPADAAISQARQMERDLEQRIVGLLEPAVGTGNVIARVSANFDTSEVVTDSERFDPDGSVLRSERSLSQASQQAGVNPSGAAGAVANQPMGAGADGTNATRGMSNTEDVTRNYEVSKTVTRSVSRSPRLSKLSVAVLVGGAKDGARPDDEVQRLGELARRAVGFDAARGDELQITSAPFATGDEDAAGEEPSRLASLPWPWIVGGGLGLGALALMALFVLRTTRGGDAMLLRPGARVGELAGAAGLPALGAGGMPGMQGLPGMPGAANMAIADFSPEARVRDRARTLVEKDPQRAATLLRAWISSDDQEVNRG